MKLSMFQTPLAERAVGAAAAAVFLAGIASAGLVDTGGGATGPVLAAPPSASTAVVNHGSTAQIPLLSESSPLRTARVGTSAGRDTARGGGTTTGTGAETSTSSGSPRSLPTTPPPSSPPVVKPPSQVPDSVDPTPSVAVAVGPISVGASPGGVGADIGGTPVGDPAAAPDQSGGVTVEVDPGVVPPVGVHLP